MNSPYGILQLRDPNELLRRERTDGDDELRREDADLAVEVLAAASNLVGSGNAVASVPGILARKAADHRADVDALSELRFGNAERLGKPAEEPFPGGVCERAPILDLMRAWRLADKHDAGTCDSARDGLAENIRTGATGEQSLDVACEFLLFRWYHCNGR